MTSSVLRVGLGPDLAAMHRARLVERLRDADSVLLIDLEEPVDPAAAHLVVDGARDLHDETDTADVRLVGADPAAVERTVVDRILPFAHNLAHQRRAFRRQSVSLCDHDERWPSAADRLSRRVRRALGPRALRVEHVGSTSVPGMISKDLVDLLVVVPDLASVDALDHADWHRAGVVPVVGDLYGIDRHDREHPQRVAVDADPGRPVNVHLHPESSPVWRELLAFRDWLRARSAHRDEYVALKHQLARDAHDDVLAYSRAKRTWINQAVTRALDPIQ